MEASENRPTPIWLITLLLLITLGLYVQTAGHDFVDYDDTGYISENPVVQQGLTASNLVWAFTTDHPPYWHPLTWLSHMLDCQLFGLNPGPHHLMSVALHALSAALLLLVMHSLTGSLWRSFFVAAIYAWHPLHVESVAWASERKDVLSGLFWILTMAAYSGYARSGGLWRYFLTAGSFALGLMSKPMVVTLPVILLLMDIWPLQRWGKLPLWRLVLEKLPLLALSGGLSVITFLMQRQAGAVASMDAISPYERLANAATGYLRYLGKAFWPSDLTVFYDRVTPQSWLVIVASILMVLLSGLSIWFVRRQRPLFVGWVWFVLTLLPTIGLIQVGRQSIADRFMHIPIIGLTIAVAWLIPEAWARRHRIRITLAGVMGLILLVCCVLTFRQVGHWKNTLTLWQRAVAVTTDNREALNNLAWLYAISDDPEHNAKSVELADRVCKLTEYRHPGYLDTLSVAYASVGQFPQAVASSTRAVEIAKIAAKHAEDTGRATDQLRLAELIDEMETRLAMFQRGERWVE